MPAFATHEIFGEEGTLYFSSQEVGRAIASHRSVFRTGCQGPDLFFYNPFISGGAEELNLGSRMHESRINLFFKNYIEELLLLRQRWELETGISYLMGFLSHYTLDCIMHPYVYSRVGRGGDSNLAAHLELEAVLEKQMLMEKRDCMPSSYYPEKRIKMTKHELSVIARLMSQSLTKTYHVKVKPGNVKSSYWCMKMEMKQVYDHSGKKKKRFYQLESLVSSVVVLSNMVVNDNLTDERDAMNHERESWVHPWESEQCCQSDVWEMYDDALERYQEYAEAISPVLAGMLQRIGLMEKQQSRSERVADALKEQIPKSVRELGNRNYHSGK